MAEIIPPLTKATLSRMEPGEKRVARRLASLLEDDYLVWYDIPVGKKQRYPDFIILHPSRGLLFLEVKDWKLDTIKKLTKTDATLLTYKGEVTKPHPLEQVRQCAYTVINLLTNDPSLCQPTGPYKGNLITPYGWGVIFTDITRKQMQKSLPDDAREIILPDHLTMYKDDISENTDAETFQQKLWNMFHYQFDNNLTLPQIDRIRWHLFPEIRINEGTNTDLLTDNTDDPQALTPQHLPDIMKIMDIQQEQLARSLGDGHRVIHGVAGSGKTMILGFRCLYLSEALTKPILVLVFNTTLAAKLRAFITAKGIGNNVQVYHFHDWCGQQLKTYHVNLLENDKPYFERQVESVIHAVDKEHIPREQYGAVLIDEGHDFEADWLKLVVQMIDPKSDSLLLLYDDAQSIYKNRSGLGFSLSSVGIQAKGRTTILRLNYRNTREILEFAYTFIRHYLSPQKADDDHIPIIEPESAGTRGSIPAVRQFDTLLDEITYTTKCLKKWHTDNIAWNDMAVLVTANYQGDKLSQCLQKNNIPHALLNNKEAKATYTPSLNQVTLLTIHSSKGLEYMKAKNAQQDARLLYVGMTRAQKYLLITTSSENEYSKKLLEAQV